MGKMCEHDLPGCVAVHEHELDFGNVGMPEHRHTC